MQLLSPRKDSVQIASAFVQAGRPQKIDRETSAIAAEAGVRQR